jgi:molecular chaperone GrpE
MSEKKNFKVDVKIEDQETETTETDTTIETSEASTPGDSVEDLEKRLAAAESDAQKAYDQFLRASAELENYKKRTQKEMSEFKKFANESLLKELLVVVDNLERAIETPQNGGGETQVAAGVDLTLKELLKIFQKFGVQPIESLGEPFDPAMHQAMLQQEVTDQPHNTVINELQRGYLLHDRLLRPAMVVVSKTKTDDAGNDADN